MSDSSKIEWTSSTWNPVAGCTRVSAGCDNCYAARLAAGRMKHTAAQRGLAVFTGSGRAAFNGQIRLLHDRLDQPLRWRKPRRIFVNSLSDLFHPDVPFEFVDQVFGVMALTPQHTYQILTKRPDRMAAYITSRGEIPLTYHHPVQQVIEHWIHERPTPEDAGLWQWPLPNLQLGTSVENQTAADERIPHLLRCPAHVRFLSCEPLLGPVDVRQALTYHRQPGEDFGSFGNVLADMQGVDWVIAGGESGPGARPCDVAWLRSLRDQCAAAGVPFFLKQLGSRPQDSVIRWVDPERQSLGAIRDPKGGDMDEWPEDLRVREFPPSTEGT